MAQKEALFAPSALRFDFKTFLNNVVSQDRESVRLSALKRIHPGSSTTIFDDEAFQQLQEVVYNAFRRKVSFSKLDSRHAFYDIYALAAMDESSSTVIKFVKQASDLSDSIKMSAELARPISQLFIVQSEPKTQLSDDDDLAQASGQAPRASPTTLQMKKKRTLDALELPESPQSPFKKVSSMGQKRHQRIRQPSPAQIIAPDAWVDATRVFADCDNAAPPPNTLPSFANHPPIARHANAVLAVDGMTVNRNLGYYSGEVHAQGQSISSTGESKSPTPPAEDTGLRVRPNIGTGVILVERRCDKPETLPYMEQPDEDIAASSTKQPQTPNPTYDMMQADTETVLADGDVVRADIVPLSSVRVASPDPSGTPCGIQKRQLTEDILGTGNNLTAQTDHEDSGYYALDDDDDVYHDNRQYTADDTMPDGRNAHASLELVIETSSANDLYDLSPAGSKSQAILQHQLAPKKETASPSPEHVGLTGRSAVWTDATGELAPRSKSPAQRLSYETESPRHFIEPLSPANVTNSFQCTLEDNAKLLRSYHLNPPVSRTSEAQSLSANGGLNNNNPINAVIPSNRSSSNISSSIRPRLPRAAKHHQRAKHLSSEDSPEELSDDEYGRPRYDLAQHLMYNGNNDKAQEPARLTDGPQFNFKYSFDLAPEASASTEHESTASYIQNIVSQQHISESQQDEGNDSTGEGDEEQVDEAEEPWVTTLDGRVDYEKYSWNTLYPWARKRLPEAVKRNKHLIGKIAYVKRLHAFDDEFGLPAGPCPLVLNLTPDKLSPEKRARRQTPTNTHANATQEQTKSVAKTTGKKGTVKRTDLGQTAKAAGSIAPNKVFTSVFSMLRKMQ